MSENPASLPGSLPRKEGVTRECRFAEATLTSEVDCGRLIEAIKHYGKLNYGKETKV